MVVGLMLGSAEFQRQASLSNLSWLGLELLLSPKCPKHQ